MDPQRHQRRDVEIQARLATISPVHKQFIRKKSTIHQAPRAVAA
jgi:hypothetical protein